MSDVGKEEAVTRCGIYYFPASEEEQRDGISMLVGVFLGESPKASDIPLTTMIVLGPLSAERRKSISAAMSHLVGLCLGADMCFPVADPSLDGGMLS